MLDRPGEAIKLPYQDDIEQPLAGVMHKRVELGTLALGAAHPLIHKFVAAAKALAGITAEVVELQLATLVDGADTRIQGHCLSLGVHDAILFAGLICFWRSCIDREPL